MKRISPITFLLIISIFVSCKKKNKVIETNNDGIVILNQDPVIKNRKDAPKSLPLLFKSGENKVAGRILVSHGSEKKPTILFLHGNPGFEKNEETGQILRRQGYNTVFFSYSGTWGNEGVFNYKNSIQDVRELVKYLSQNAKQFRIDTQQIYLCGHSTGADIAILSGFEIPEIKTIISIDPWDGYNTLNSKSEEELNKYISNLEQRPCINVTSGMDFVNGIIWTKEMALEAPLSSESNTTIHIFSSKLLKSKFKENHNYIKENNMIVVEACDHSFSDKRIELAETIIDCLHREFE